MLPFMRKNILCGPQVVQCRREELAAHLARSDMAVPLMARMDAPVLDAAPRLRCILQYGVGVEGIDIPAVREAAYSTRTHKNCLHHLLC
jgi:lactate dehydrogenase-like 2-hydroxyacid dehydrogenase